MSNSAQSGSLSACETASGSGISASALLADRITDSLAGAEIRTDQGTRKVGASVGIAVSELFDSSVEALIERADEALYVAKAKGRGQVRWSQSPHSAGLPAVHPV